MSLYHETEPRAPVRDLPGSSPFPGFIIGGFECADHINRCGQRVNLLADTHHDVRVEEDYAAIAALGIHAVREGICWSFVERAPFDYDFTEVRRRIRAGVAHQMVQCWDLCHFGYPDDLMPTHPQFVARFVALCQAFVQVFREEAGGAPLIITPVNEISFLSWHSGEVRGTVPFAEGCGWDIKYHLCKAVIAGVRAVRALDRYALIMHVEPMIHIHTDDPLRARHVAEMNEEQFQAMDILMGRLCPELGGSPNLTDIVGVNYYFTNQWDVSGPLIPWAPGDDSRLIPVHELMAQVADRYHKPLVLSETGHYGEHRPQWLGMIMEQCAIARERGIDLLGACIYPVIDRCDWDRLEEYIPCGLFSYCDAGNRSPHRDSISMVQMWADRLKPLYLQGFADVGT